MGDESLTLDIVNDANGVAQALEQLEAFLQGSGCGTEAAGQIMLVADEVVSNVVRCAFAEQGQHRFTLSVAPEPGGTRPQLRLRVEDDGAPFDPTTIAVPALDASIDQREIGGLGMHLVRSLARSIRYTRETGLNRLDIVLDATPG